MRGGRARKGCRRAGGPINIYIHIQHALRLVAVRSSGRSARGVIRSANHVCCAHVCFSIKSAASVVQLSVMRSAAPRLSHAHAARYTCAMGISRGGGGTHWGYTLNALLRICSKVHEAATLSAHALSACSAHLFDASFVSSPPAVVDLGQREQGEEEEHNEEQHERSELAPLVAPLEVILFQQRLALPAVEPAAPVYTHRSRPVYTHRSRSRRWSQAGACAADQLRGEILHPDKTPAHWYLQARGLAT